MTYSVRQTDDRGNVYIQQHEFVVVAQIEQELARRAGEEAGVEATAECANGDRIVVGPPGTTFPCTVSDAADPSDIAEYTATVTDDRGSVQFD